MLWGNTIMLGVIFSLGKYDMNYDAVNLAAFYSIHILARVDWDFSKEELGFGWMWTKQVSGGRSPPGAFS